MKNDDGGGHLGQFFFDDGGDDYGGGDGGHLGRKFLGNIFKEFFLVAMLDFVNIFDDVSIINEPEVN